MGIIRNQASHTKVFKILIIIGELLKIWLLLENAKC